MNNKGFSLDLDLGFEADLKLDPHPAVAQLEARNAYADLFWRPYLTAVPYALYQTLAAVQTVVRGRADGRWPIINDLVVLMGAGDRATILGREATKTRPRQVGALDRLVAENIVVCFVRGDGRNRRYEFDAHPILPLLTPKQIQRLDPAVKEMHLEWLTQRRVNTAVWRQVTAETMVKPLGMAAG